MTQTRFNAFSHSAYGSQMSSELGLILDGHTDNSVLSDSFYPPIPIPHP
jgi:hypothetical protein